MSKRSFSAVGRQFVVAAALTTVLAVSPQASASPRDDRDPGFIARVQRAISRVVRAILPQDGIIWPTP
jgi:hypothetical protein